MKEKADDKKMKWEKAQLDPRFMTEVQAMKHKLIENNLNEIAINPKIPKLTEEYIANQVADRERLIYGRSWIWEGYFNEKNKDKWLYAAEKLKNINEHVIEDI